MANDRWRDEAEQAQGKSARRNTRSNKRRQARPLLFEPLEERRLLAVTDFASIGGIVYKDATGNGFTPGEQIAGASVQLFRDVNGNNQLDAGDGAALQSAVTNANGAYRFNRLSAGSYFVRQPAQTVGGMNLPEEIVGPIQISPLQAQGTVGVPIDGFTTQQTVMAPFPVGTAASSSQIAPEAIGGERDMIGTLTAGGNLDSVTLTSSNSRLAFDPSFNATGIYRVVWDGPDGNATVTNFTGLNGQDLTQGGTATHFELSIGVDKPNGVAMLRIYTDQNNWSQVTIPLVESPSQEYLISFTSDFSIGAGSGANFANVGAIEFQVQANVTAMDGEMTVIGSRGPTVINADIDNFSAADLSLTKQADTLTPNVGANLIFTITVANAGPDAATGVAVTDLLPANLTFVRSTPSQGTYNSTNGVWSVGTVAAGGQQTLQITATANSPAVTINTAQVTASQQFDPDSTPNNNVTTEDDQASITISPQSADLSLTKSVNDTAPNLGGAVQFTIEVRNSGPSTATGVEVIDLLPPGLAFSSFQATQGSYNNSSGVWTVGTLANGGTAQLQIHATITQNGTITNTAQVSRSNQTDPDSTPNNNVATEDDQASVSILAQAADLSLVKTVSNPNPNLNQNVVFTLTVMNAGPDPASGIEVTDRLPQGIAFVSISPPNASYNSSTGIWSIDTIPAGGQATLQITGTVTSIGAKTNTAEITRSQQFDPDSTPGNGVTNEDDIASIVVTPQTADLSLSKTVTNAAPNVGQSVVFNVVVRNDGPNAATNVVVRDTLGPGLSFVNATQTQGDFNSGTGQWNVGSLAAGVTATLQITAVVNSIGTKVNTAEVIASSQFDPDSTPGNSSPQEDDQASVTVTPTAADLSLTKTVSNLTPSVNENFSFTITVSNSGPNTATNVAVRDLLPSGLSFVQATATQGSYNATTGIWTVGSIANAAQAMLEIVVRPSSDQPQTNTAQVQASDQFDPDSTPNNDVANEDDQQSVSVTPQSADLSLTKTASDERPNVGDNVTFTLVVRNAGPSATSGVLVRDVLPNSVNFVSATASLGSYTAANGIWDVGQLGRDTTATLQIVATIVNATPFTNTAEITRSTIFDPDSTPDNKVANEDDQASITITPRSADLSLKKTVSDSTPNVGQTVTFTVSVSNAGPDPATNVTVKDSLPAGAAFVSSTASQGTFNRTTGIWTVGSIAKDVTATLEIVVTVDQSLPQTNTAEVMTSNQFDPDSTPGNANTREDDFSSVSFTPEIADLSLNKTVDKSTPNVGERVNFKLTVANGGPSDATNVVVRDLLADGLMFVSSSPSSGAYNAATGQWTIATIGSGRSATLEIIAQVTSVGEKINTAEIVAVDQFDPDSTPGNNVPSEDDQKSLSLLPQLADLSLSKTVNQTRPNVGENVTFSLTLQNAGPNDATNVTVRDQLPAGLMFVSATPTRGVYNVTAGEWRVGTAPVGSVSTLILVGKVLDSTVKTNTAEVIAVDQFDPDSTPNNTVATEDDQSTAVVTPLAADLSLVKLVDNASPNMGDEVSFTIGIGNAGPDPASGVVVMDLLPAGLEFVRAVASQGVYTPENGVWSVGSIPVNVGASLEIVARVATIGNKTNKAEIIVSNVFDPDSTPNNNNAAEDDQASVLVMPQSADLSLTKTVSNATPNVGDNVTFTVAVQNSGPNRATGVVVRDLLPSGMEFVSSTATTGSYNSGTGLWIIDTLAETGTQTLQIVARVAGPTVGTNVAEVVAADQADPDSTPQNNVPGEDDQASAQLTPQVVDMTIVKIGSSDPAIAGQLLTYTLTVANLGPANATNVVVTDTLPAGVTFQSASADDPSATISHTTGVVTVNSPRLRSGASAVITIVVRLGNETKGTLTNTAQIIAQQFDLQTANNVSTLNTRAILPPSTISGVVYIDMDNDGIRDANETAIGGVKITLEGMDEDGNPVYRTLITGSDGRYVFDHLQPGEYTVTETQPSLFGSGKATAGNPNLGQVVNNDQFFFRLGADQNAANFNFGETFPFLTRRDCLTTSPKLH